MDTVLIENHIILKPLSDEDALAFYGLYNPDSIPAHPVTGDKTPLEFTRHIILSCNDIYTIRLRNDSGVIIGDCALHDWDELKGAIEIGGTLLHEYWGKGIMKVAFELLIARAQQQYLVDKIIAKTEMENIKAIKFAQKMGFSIAGVAADTVLLEKKL